MIETDDPSVTLREKRSDLLEAYRRQESLYGRVLELAAEGLRRLRRGAGLEQLEGLNRRKAALLAELGEIEEQIANEKQRWQESGAMETNSAELDAVLANISVLIDQTLLLERAIEQRIVQGSLADESRG